MSVGYQLRRLSDFASAARLSRRLGAQEIWSPERLAAHRQARLDHVVGHAIAHSRFYRERLASSFNGDGVQLGRLPSLSKAEMMERFDDLVTDPRLRRDDLMERVERTSGEEYHLGEYRLMTTSGSTGLKGLFAYDRLAWRSIVAQFLRCSAVMGVEPRLPRRYRLASVTGAVPSQMSRQIFDSVAVGVHRVLRLPVTTPVNELVERLNRFQPDGLSTYPSMALTLAEEQLAGRLRLSPSTVTTTSELRTPEATARLTEAFGVPPFDAYATTEGLWGIDCEKHRGIHLFEDVTVIENVDGDDRPVPPGEPGARLLVTSLYNHTQPLIRLELGDSVTIDPEPCACGRSLIRMRAIEGRSDDVLRLPGRDGEVTVHPIEFGVITRDRGVQEFQVRREGGALRVLCVPRDRGDAGLEDRLRERVTERLVALGVDHPRVSVERRERLPRGEGGKLRLVVSEKRSPAGVVQGE